MVVDLKYDRITAYVNTVFSIHIYIYYILCIYINIHLYIYIHIYIYIQCTYRLCRVISIKRPPKNTAAGHAGPLTGPGAAGAVRREEQRLRRGAPG